MKSNLNEQEMINKAIKKKSLKEERAALVKRVEEIDSELGPTPKKRTPTRQRS